MDVSSECEKPVEVLKAKFYQKATRWLWLQKDYRAYISFSCDFKPTMLKSDVQELQDMKPLVVREKATSTKATSNPS